MLRILDRYIIKKLLSTYVFVMAILMAILIVIQYTELNEDFIKNKVPTGKIILEYFLPYIPYMANMLSPLMIFIASVVVTARMAGHTEIIAMLSGGISFRRLMVPYVLASSLVGVIIFISICYYIPRANKVRVAFENQYIKDKFYFDKKHVHMKVAPTSYVYMESYNNIAKTGYQFSMEHIEGKELIKKVKTGRVYWNTEKNCWTLDHYTSREYKDGKEILRSGVTLDTVISLSPKDFESNYLLYETFTIDELNQYIDLLKLRGAENIEAYYIEKDTRFAYPFAIVILTVMGGIVASRKTRGGAALQIAFGFVLAFVYILFVVMSRNIASAGVMPTVLAAWLPNLTFAAIGFLLYLKVPK